MSQPLYPIDALYAGPSVVHGYGVFARRRIRRGEVVMRCRCLVLNRPIEAVDEPLASYVYEWPLGGDNTAVALGDASLFNHDDRPNADWKTDVQNEMMVFHALRDLEPDEEVFIDYGEAYWERHLACTSNDLVKAST